ncbi:MAG: AI-2E family transporter [Oscillatoriales cyanobacterium RM2_1_1]|nr:AI-2E family transporter [Oscillatoriales cyanobacterium RM2_1_1]
MDNSTDSIHTTNNLFSPIQKFLITWLLLLITGALTLSAIEYVGELIGILVTAGLIAFVLNYPVIVLQRYLPRGLAAALVYLIAAIIVVVFGLTIVPPVLIQGRQLVTRFPDLLESGKQQLIALQTWSTERNLPFNFVVLQQQLFTKFQGGADLIAARGFGLVLGTFNWFIDFVLILVISFYMLLDGERLWQGITQFFSPKVRHVLTESLARNLQGFVVGQFVLGAFMAITLTLTFSILQVPYFLVFAVFIGLMEVIPFIGATLGIGTVTIIVAFIDIWLALKVLVAAVILQQIKDNLVTPRIMGNITGLSPVVIFSVLILGGETGGLLGVILAIPLTGVVKSIVEVLLDPDSPPQTGSFFANPFDQDLELEEQFSKDSIQNSSKDAEEVLTVS